MKLLFYAALLLGSAAIVAGSSGSTPAAPQQCTWGGLGFNPYARWNVFSFNDIGSAVMPFGSDFQGRGAAVGNIWVNAFTFNVIGDNSYPFAATAGGTFTQTGGDVINGGIQAAGKVTVKNMHVQGDIISTDDTIKLGGTTSGEAVTGTGAAKAKLWFQYGTGSSMAGGIYPNTNGLSLDVDLLAVKAFFQAESAHYFALANTVTTVSYTGGLNGDLRISVVAGLNVLTIPGNGVTVAQFKNAARLLLKGPYSARLVINIAGTSHALDTLDVYQHPSSNVWTYRPTTGRLLLNFHEATSLTMVSPSYFTLLAPLANLQYTTGVIHGNVIVNNLVDPDGSGAQVNLMPWVPDCPAEVPPAPPSPQDTGDVPSPPEECPQCPWDDALGFNPWEFYNIFSLGSIGSAAVPCGADYQGRLGAINSVWVKSFSVHDIYQGVGPQFSASVGGNFNLFGGSVHNGGIEAGGNVYLESANVDGAVVALGDAVIGVPGKAVTVLGAVSAGGNLAWAVGQSSAGGGFFDHAAPLSITAPLVSIGQYFKDTAAAYAAMANTLVEGVGYSFGPDAVNPDDILVTLQAGINVISISSSQLQKASRLLLSGDLSGVLIINVADVIATFDNLDVYVNGPTWTLHPSFGQVIVNLYAATTVSVPWGSGQWSLLAPYADVTYTSGLWTGNWVVGNLLCSPSGGSQLNSGHWSPPCPECEDVELGKSKVKIAGYPPSRFGGGDDGDDRRIGQSHDQKTVAQAATSVQTDRLQQKIAAELPSWVMPVGVFVCAVALAAMVVAGVAFVKLSNLKQQRVSAGQSSTPTTPSLAMSPRYPTSP